MSNRGYEVIVKVNIHWLASVGSILICGETSLYNFNQRGEII